jgi:hypothetical protein
MCPPTEVVDVADAAFDLVNGESCLNEVCFASLLGRMGDGDAGSSGVAGSEVIEVVD